MNYYSEPNTDNNYLSDYVSLITISLRKLARVEIVDFSLSPRNQAKQAFEADYILLAHNATDEPCFRYANRSGLKLFEMSWEEFTSLLSKYSAERENQAERHMLLDGVKSKGYVDNYSGIRISKSGRRFEISDAMVWNVLNLQGRRIGQAAMFRDYKYIRD